MTHQEKLHLIKLGLHPKECVPKPKKPLNKISPKKKAEITNGSEDDRMDIFYENCRHQLKGRCLFCNGGTFWKHEKMWRSAIAHLLPKSKFKSVAAHESNWVELCLSCHRSFDDGNISWMMLFDSLEWTILKEKLSIILPFVKEDERKNKLYDKLQKMVCEKEANGR